MTKVHISAYGDLTVESDGNGGMDLGYVGLDGIQNLETIRVQTYLTDLEALRLRDALLELYPLPEKRSEVGTVVVNVTADTSQFRGEVTEANETAFGDSIRGIVREEVQALAESALDYAVKPAAQQALANLAGAAELAGREGQ